MSNTLEAIRDALIAEAQGSGGKLNLDNSVIQSDSYANILSAANVETVPVNVGSNPATNIYVQAGTLYVKGTASLYNGNLPDFILQLTGEIEPTRTAQFAGTLSSLNINNLNSLGLISTNPTLPSLSFSSIGILAQSNPPKSGSATVTLSINKSTNSWSILPDIGINLTSVGLSIVRDAFQNSTLNVSGDFVVGSKTINVTVSIPASQMVAPVWGISLSAGVGKTLIDLGDISQLLAGTNVFSQLPPGLSAVGNFGIVELQVQFTQDNSGFSIQQVYVNIGCNNWPVGPSGSPIFIITSMGVMLTVQNPFNSSARSISTVIYGNFQLDPNDPTTVLDITMTIPSGNSDWVLNAAGSFNLKNVAAFNKLPGGFNSGNINLPDTVSSASLAINYFTISFNPSSLQLSYITFSISLNATWWIIDNYLGIANPQLQVYIPGASLQNPPPLSVYAAGQILLPDDIILDVSASYERGGAWSFSAALGEGSEVNLLKVVQQLMGSSINPDKKLGLDSLLITELAINISSDPKSKLTTYDFNATTTASWVTTFGQLPSINAIARLGISYDGKNTNGSVAITLDVFGIEFIVKYAFSTNNGYQLELDWKGFSFTYDSTGNTITAKGGDWTLGGMLTALINEIDPSLDFSLPDPWSLLNSISLKGLYLQINLTDKSITVGYTLSNPIKLFFIDITGISLAVEKSSQVNVQIQGSYLGGKPIPKWDAVSQQPPAVPGSGSDLFYLKFLALGQHVSLTGLSSIKTVNDALTQFEKYLKPPDQSSGTIPVKATPNNPPQGTLVFDANSSWLIAADFTVAKFYQLQFVFNDPNLYGLRIAIAGGDFFKNLDFEILYKKITDTIGMYQVDLQLPDEFRHLEFGEVSITLPNVTVRIYTNGDFYIDFGFPVSITDFSRSFSVQVFPFVGYGGFYFGMLSGATSTNVPVTTYGQFNPVIEFGLALSLGVGKTINAGILSAGLSLTVVGMFEGVLGFYTCYADGSQKDTYYRIQATVGIVGHIYGSVNFAIISAQFDILAYIYATIVIEAYKPIPISFQAGVTIKLTVKINLGLFSISISLSFSATISASFTIGSDTSAQALWNRPCTGTLEKAMLAAAAQTYKLVWQPLTYDNGLAAPPAMNLYFIPHLTVAQGTGKYAAQYVAMLYIDAPAPGDTTDKSSLGSLAQGVLAWAINAVVNSGTGGTTFSALLKQNVTLDQLTALMCVLNDQQDNLSPFDYNNTATPGNDVNGFLKAYFTNGGKSTINIVPVAADTSTSINAAVFPPFPDLQLNATYNGTGLPNMPVDFSKSGMTGTQNYLSDVTTMLNLLNVNYKSNTAASDDESPICELVDNGGTVQQTNLSLPTFFFTDFISLIAKQMIQGSLDYMNGKELTTINIGELFGAVCTPAATISLSGMASRFLLHGLRLPTPPVAATGAIAPLYAITGQQVPLPVALKTGDKFTISLQKAAATNWIGFNGDTGATALPITISDTEITRIVQTTGVQMTPVIEPGFPKPAATFSDGKQAFTLGSPALWQYPGNYYNGVTNKPYVLKLPGNLQNALGNYSGSTPSFSVQYLDTTATNPQPVDIKNYTWATAINITVQKITLPEAIHSPLLGNMYNLVGADDTGVFFLESLVSFLNSPEGKNYSGQVQLLYQADPTNNSNGGFISALNNTKTPPDQLAMAIVQANLSTETNPEGMLMAFAAERMQAQAPSNTLNSFSNFVTLLWECSIVRSGGYYFYYNNIAGGNAGLPDNLFTNGNAARLQILITYDQFVAQAFMNSMVIGDNLNFANTSVFAQSASFMLRSAVMPQGNVGYLLQRKYPGDYVPPASPTTPPSLAMDEIYLEHQFNLIGVTLPVNAAYQNLLPSGPVDADNTGADVKTADDGIWNYSRIIPYNQFVPNALVKWGMVDPYAGIGTQASILLNWQDMFGNTLPLGNGSPQVTKSLLYTDQLVVPSQWPSTSFYYQFSGDGKSNPQFQLSFVFNIDRYKAGDESAQNNAAVDMITWARLWFQLNRNTDMKMFYTVSINATSSAPAGAAQAIDINALKGFVEPIVDYLFKVANTSGAVPPPTNTTYNVSFAVDPATVTSYEYIFSLVTVITMQRSNNVDPDFAQTPGVAMATTPVQPYTQQQDGKGTSTLLYFTQLFETAFNNPSSTVVYKVSTATNLSTSSSDPVKAPPVWIVRFDTSGAKGINLTYKQDNTQNTIAYYFAPVPLATSLQNFQASIIPYATGVPFDPNAKGTTTNFASIDLDNWGGQMLAAADKFLSPAYAVPAFLLDNGVSLQKVLDAKQVIAQAITGTVDYIIEPVPDRASSLASMNNAQEKWYQQLLNQLSSAYTYTAAVQTPVTIASCWTGPNNDPPVAGGPPRLYGKIVGTPPESEGQTKSTEQDASFSAAKLPIATGDSWLTYMFQIQNEQSQSITFPEVDYAISHIEWQYESVEGIDGYMASSWLLIVSPQTLPATYTEVGETEIPIPLKAYPSSPVVSAQSSNYPSVTPPQTQDPVIVARSWDYTCTYQAPAVPQDTTIMQVQFNVMPKDKNSLRAMDAPAPTLDQALAQFMNMYPQLSSDFDQYLINVKSAADPNAKNAANAVNAFISILGIIGTAWGKWNQVNPFRPKVTAKAAVDNIKDPVPAMVTLQYTIEETSLNEMPANPLIINVTPDSTNVWKLVPVIDIAGYTRSTTTNDNTTSYTYVNTETGEPLLYNQRNSVPVRNTSFETLDVLNTQNGRAGLQLKRNLFLLAQRGSTTKWQTTNPLFIYQTPLVMFYSLYQPLFNIQNGINIALIPSPDGSLPQQRTLMDHLIALGNSLTINTNGLTSITVKAQGMYAYQVGNTQLPISIPVLLLPPYPVKIADNGKAFAALVQENLTYWFSQHDPTTNQAMWMLDLQLYSSFGNNLPMLTGEFYLELSSILSS